MTDDEGDTADTEAEAMATHGGRRRREPVTYNIRDRYREILSEASSVPTTQTKRSKKPKSKQQTASKTRLQSVPDAKLLQTRSASEDQDDKEPMPRKRTRVENDVKPEQKDDERSITTASTAGSFRAVNEDIAQQALQRGKEKRKAELMRQLREIGIERELAELDD